MNEHAVGGIMMAKIIFYNLIHPLRDYPFGDLVEGLSFW